METAESINIQGTIECLAINERVCLPRALCKLRSVRAIAGAITGETGKKYSVSGKDAHNITVTRVS